MKKYLSILSLSALALLGCNDQNLADSDGQSTVQINVTVGSDYTSRLAYDASNGLATNFTNGDQVTVYAVDSIDLSETSPAVYQYDGTKWTAANPLLVYKGDNYYFRAFYPTTASMDNFTIADDQTADYSLNDWMTASADNGNVIAWNGEALNFQMAHKLAKLKLKITYIGENIGATLKTATTLSPVEIKEGLPNGENKEIKMQIINDQAFAIVSQCANGETVFNIELSNGRKYTVKDNKTYSAGTFCTYSLTVGKETATIDHVDVAPWATKENTGTSTDVTPYNALGAGTEADPYRIFCAAQLRHLAQTVNGGNSFSGVYLQMTNDIDLNPGITFATDGTYTGNTPTEWTAIGNDEKPFSGHFDGNNHTVSGVYINNDKSYQGLFGYISEATIQHVGVINSYIKGKYFVGGVCGYNDNSSVTHCYNTGTVTGSYYVGGVCGANNNSSVTNCYNTGTVTGSSYVGGVCGDNYNSSSVINCYYLVGSCANGIGYGTGSATSKPVAEMQTKEFVNALNNGDTAFVYNADGYPKLTWEK